MRVEEGVTEKLNPKAAFFLIRLPGLFIHKYKLSKLGLYAVHESSKQIRKDQ